MIKALRILPVFARSPAGNFSVTFALSAIAIMGVAGASLDYSRIYQARAGMATALDAAVMATAAALNEKDMTQAEVEENVSSFIAANMAESNPAMDVYKVSDVAVDYSTQQVTARISADVPMSMMGVLGWKVMPVSIASATQFGTNLSEVAMTFDVTGSMSGAKLTALKTAAKEGIAILLDVNTPTRKRLRVSAIPYASAVNAGPLKPYTFAQNASYTGEPPKIGDKFKPSPDGCASERVGLEQFSDAGPAIATVNRDSRITGCPAVSVQLLTADEALLADAVNKLQASGTTAGQIGIQWAWYTIAPEWASYMPAESQPGPYGTQLRKYAIIMTDGEFNTAYADVKTSQSVSSQSAKSMKYAISLCDNMKKKGIQIFTVGFDLKEKTAIDTLKLCASPAEGGIQYFYSAKTGAELVEVYKIIAQRIKTVRLVK
jgi:Flp pilus assembly protein TadG